MKRFIWFIIFLCSIVKIGFSQEAIGKYYKLKVEHQMQECTINGDTSGFIKKELLKDAIFTVVNKVDDNYVVRFWNWGNAREIEEAKKKKTGSASKSAMLVQDKTNSTSQDKIVSYNFSQDEQGNWHQRYFIIPISDLTVLAAERENAWSPAVGVATLPFKARGGTADFTKDVSISGIGGFKHRGLFKWFPNTDWSTLFGIGIASVTLDSSNTNNTIKKAGDFAAISLSIGEVIEWKKLQIGLFIGWDNLKASDVNGWKYQGKTWWGIGIGFSIFSESSPGKEETNNVH
ncbi:hypothetical protein GS399_15845 [Pedobacter sp. HMF7647]|uniref:Uncharacterized protein n=1 Tax=Hufsiella arboris TaxID=2695275 RepID=A0A7K1YEJ3_9SPHI|nr:hypothetical protein [Hufsiella arboris]MXV52448.1 hypothetical protein [Hufsiella arboris]